MKQIEDRATIVGVGAFNPAILTPQWIAKYGLELKPNDQFNVEMLAPVVGVAQPRFGFLGLSFAAGTRNLTFYIKNADIESGNKSVAVFAKLLAELKHTPIEGIGFNFAFEFKSNETSKALLLESEGLASVFSEDASIVSRRWGNSIIWEDAIVNIDCESVGEDVRVLFNFHHEITAVEQAIELFQKEGIYKKHFDKAVQAVKEISHEELE